MFLPKRVSSMLVTSDLAAAAALYEQLGFARVETDTPGCIGYLAGTTGVILVDRQFANGCWGAAAESFAERIIPYIHVTSLDAPSPASATVLADVHTSYGTRERVLSTPSGPIVLAETMVQ